MLKDSKGIRISRPKLDLDRLKNGEIVFISSIWDLDETFRMLQEQEAVEDFPLYINAKFVCVGMIFDVQGRWNSHLRKALRAE
jgi:hypothetical protein